jgi:uncharacterized protein (DUF1697 family)
MVNRCVALLRAINVTNRFVRMADLRGHLEGLDGLSNVATFIQSGNVLFDAGPEGLVALEARIEARLAERLGFPVAAFARSAPEMHAAVENWPFSAREGQPAGGYVAFLREEPLPDQRARLESLCGPADALQVLGNQLYWRVDARLGKTTVSGALIERALRAECTMRNITTVRKLAAIVSTG